MFSTKMKVHLQRWLALHTPRVFALACVLGALYLTVGLVARSIRVVELSDSEGGYARFITISQTFNTIYPQLDIAPPGPYDSVDVTYADGGEQQYIRRAFGVPITADGVTTTVVSTGETVEQLLRDAGLTWDLDDEILPGLHTPTENGTEIKLYRVEYRYYTQEESIPVETEYIYTSLYWRARFQNLQTPVRQGSEGVDSVTYMERWVDGALVHTVEMERQTVTEMVTDLVKVYGEKAPVSQLVGPEIVDGVPVTGVATVYRAGRATGYSSNRGLNARGASGRPLIYGTVAVDPKMIPYGSLLYIRSTSGSFVYGYAYAADTGTALVTGHALVDLYYETYTESVQNEVMAVDVYVIDPETAALYAEANQAIIAADNILGR